VRRLTDSARVRCAVVAAPAGYGKTTLLRQWDACDPRPFAWATLDASHDDAGALVRAIASALDTLEPTGDGVVKALPRRHSTPGAVLTRVRRRAPFVLVLDDAHVIRDSDAIDALRAVASHLPPGSQLALGTRGEPPLPIGRLRVNRELAEVRARDLAMTTAEGAALLRSAGAAPTAPQLEALMRMTEGWPAGLYLAALTLRDQAGRADAAEDFSGEDVVVSDYMRDEVLAALPSAAADFLVHTSVLEELSGPACDLVLGRSDSARMLHSLARRNVMLVPLDRHGDSYRCHSMLREMLQGELRRVPERRAAELHARASEWYELAGDTSGALRHAIVSGDLERAADLLWQTTPYDLGGGRHDILAERLEQFTEEQKRAHPKLALATAHLHAAHGSLEAAELWEQTARESSDAGAESALEAGFELLRATLGRDGVEAMASEASRAYGLSPQSSGWRAICCLIEGVGLHLSGDAAGAQERLEEGVRRGAAAAPAVQSQCLAHLSLLAIEREDWDAGAALIARATAQLDRHALVDEPSSAVAFAAAAAIRAQLGRTDDARRDARHAGALLRSAALAPWYEAEAKAALARAAMRLGDLAMARRLLAEAAVASSGAPDAPGLEKLMAAVRRSVESVSQSGDGQGSSLTAAELRILGFLPTHLSFREIAGRLYVSANTVKTQAHSVYRKLDASSRSEAVAHAAKLGLIDA
jgi:LuxR family transcriptional regulator, maltose regulon positive regulatory protein